MRAWKIGFFVFVSVMLIAFVVLLTTATPILRATLKAMSASLQRDYGLRLDFHDVQTYGLFGVEVFEPSLQTADKQLDVKAKSLRATLSLWGYLFDGVPIDRIEVINPDIFVRSSSDPSVQVKTSFALNQIDIVNARIQFESDKGNLLFHSLNANLVRQQRRYLINLNAGLTEILTAKLNYELLSIESNFEYPLRDMRLAVATHEGDVEITGRLDKEQFMGQIQTSRLLIDDNSVGPILSDLVINRHMAELRRAQVQFAGTTVHLNVHADLGDKVNVTLQAHARELWLYDLLEDLDVKKPWIDLTVDVDVKGTGQLWPNFELKTQAQGKAYDLVVTDGPARATPLNPLMIRSVNPIYFDSDWLINSEVFSFERAHLDDGVSFGDLSCALFFDKHIGLKLQGDFSRFDFMSIASQIDDHRFDGAGHAKVSISGPYKSLTIEAKGDVDNLAFEKFILGKTAAKIHYHKDILTFHEARGRLSFDFSDINQIDLEVKNYKTSSRDLLSAIPLAWLQDLNWVEPVILDVKLTGPIQKGYRNALRGDVKLHSPQIDLNVDVTAHTAKLLTQDLKLDGQMKGERWQIAGDYLSGRGQLLLEGVYAERGAFWGTADLQYMSLKDIFTTWDLPQELDVSAGAHLQVQGHLNDWDNVNGTLEFYPATVNYAGLKLLSKDPIAFRFKGTHFDVERFVLGTSHGDYIKVSGGLNGRQSDFHLAMRGDLWLLPFLNDRVETAYGDWEAKLDMTGDVTDPRWSGMAEIKHGFITLRDYTSPIENVDLLADLNDHQINVNQLSGQVKKGHFDGHGSLLLKAYDLGSVDLIFNFHKLPFNLSTWMFGLSTGHLKLSGLKNNLTLAGNIQVSDALVSRDIDWDEAAKNLNFAPPVIDPRGGVVKPLALDVHFVSDNGIVIDNNALSAKLGARLHIVGNKEAPGLRGSVNLVSGDAYFKNHHYRLLTARADFDDAYRIWPVFNIEAESHISDYDILVRLQGTLDRPKIQLSSRPALSENNVLNLVTLGYINSNTDTSARTAGIEALSSYTNVGQKLINWFPRDKNRLRLLKVDELRLTSLFSKKTGLSLPAILLGVEVWNGVRLRLQSTLLDDVGVRETRLELEQSFMKGLRWRAVWDSGGLSNYGDAGLDLWYRWEF